MLDRRFVLTGLAGLPLAALPLHGVARAQGTPAAKPAEFYPVPVELLAGLDSLRGKVTLGNPNADIRLIEFFDYNCPYCKNSARDIRPLMAANKDLAITLVNYAVLGIPSIGATRVALAFSMQKPAQYLAFHEQLLARRGTVGPDHAIEIALKLGAKRAQLVEDADSDVVTAAMRAASTLGSQLGMQATPSYLMGRDAHAGFLDRPQKQAAIAAFRTCERAVCG
jgi:protein-disulfide isomerase